MSKTDNCKMGKKRKDIDDSDVHYMYEVEGMSQQEIAEYYGVTQQCIYWRLHPEKKKENGKQWRESDKCISWIKEWMQSYKRKEYLKKYNQSSEKEETQKRYWQSEKGKEQAKKKLSKRRGLDFIPINNQFDEGEFHHYDKEHVICIPAEIHQSIYHNVWTGQGMEEINKEAFEFLDYELREEAWDNITGDWMVGEY